MGKAPEEGGNDVACAAGFPCELDGDRLLIAKETRYTPFLAVILHFVTEDHYKLPVLACEVFIGRIG